MSISSAYNVLTLTRAAAQYSSDASRTKIKCTRKVSRNYLRLLKMEPLFWMEKRPKMRAGPTIMCLRVGNKERNGITHPFQSP